MSKQKGKAGTKVSMLPSGAPDDGYNAVRETAALVAGSDEACGEGVEPDAALETAPAAIVSSKMKEAEQVQRASRMLRAEARGALLRRVGKLPEDLDLVCFKRPWKMYQPDGKSYGFSPKTAKALVASGIAYRAEDGPKAAKQRIPPTQARAAKGRKE